MIDTARFQRFKDQFRSRRPVLGTICATMSPVVTEIIGYAGFDFVVLDTEDQTINPETLESMVRAAECTGLVPMIKVKHNNRVVIADALNTGAPCIKVPHVTSAAELAEAIDAAYFHPRGHRGLCNSARANRYGQGKMADLIEWTNSEAMVVPIIEDREAVERIDELMAVEGVELYDIGPVDLSHSYHEPPDKGYSNPKVSAALERIIESAAKHGKHLMTTPVLGVADLTPEMVVERLMQRGISTIFYRNDQVILRMGFRQALRIRELA